MKKYLLNICLFILLFLSFSWILDIYDEEISEFNGKVTNLLRGNDFALRTFDEHGIPISNFGRLGIKDISPFYVVHYGLIYSEKIKHKHQYNYLWEYNNSIKYWNVPPAKKYITTKNFYYAADWVIKNMKKDFNNKYHLFYNFNWHYKHLKGNLIKAPWYSGLTDGMALTLLCRAYISSNDIKYKNAAFKFYKSVISTKNIGGSTIVCKDGNLWIEEYVVSDLPDNFQPRVLNGMIYATFGVYFFEKTFNIPNKKYTSYLKTIRKQINKFDLGYWTSYDLIGTVADYKYHHVHIGLLDDLYKLTKDEYYKKLKIKWQNYHTSFIKRHFFYTTPTINSLMSFLEYITFLIIIEYLLLKIIFKLKRFI